jgi:hypothetical protein
MEEGLNIKRFRKLRGFEGNAEKADNFRKWRLAAGRKGGTRRQGGSVEHFSGIREKKGR